MTSRTFLTAIGALAALAVAASPASATSLQTQAGVPYTGALNTALVVPPGVHVDTSQGDVDCNQSPITAAITSAGSTGGPATGNISALDFTNNGNQFCPDTIGIADHLNFTAQTLPWAANFDWLSDNTGGTRNGTVTFSSVTFLASFTTGSAVNCTYRGDFNNTGGTTNQLEADFFNPNNTASGNTEMRLVTEPFELASGDPGCSLVPTSQLSATYNLTGAGAAKLQIRQNPPPAPLTPASGGVAGKKKKCKKKKSKKRAAGAKKKCKRKKR